MESEKNIMKMIGIKVEIVCIPVPTPSANSEISQRGELSLVNNNLVPSTNIVPEILSKKSTNIPPMFIVSQNTR